MFSSLASGIQKVKRRVNIHKTAFLVNTFQREANLSTGYQADATSAHAAPSTSSQPGATSTAGLPGYVTRTSH